jgi:hypothetical protein
MRAPAPTATCCELENQELQLSTIAMAHTQVYDWAIVQRSLDKPSSLYSAFLLHLIRLRYETPPDFALRRALSTTEDAQGPFNP